MCRLPAINSSPSSNVSGARSTAGGTAPQGGLIWVFTPVVISFHRG